jgi:hypothetical protein
VPFVSKATGVQFARIAAQVMGGKKLSDIGVEDEPQVNGVAVKGSGFPVQQVRCGCDSGPGDAIDGRGDGLRRYLSARGIRCNRIFKVGEGRPNIVDALISGEIHLLINTPLGKKSQYDDYAMRRGAIINKTPYCTTLSAASAACDAAIALKSLRKEVMSLQERYASAIAQEKLAV